MHGLESPRDAPIRVHGQGWSGCGTAMEKVLGLPRLKCVGEQKLRQLMSVIEVGGKKNTRSGNKGLERDFLIKVWRNLDQIKNSPQARP